MARCMRFRLHFASVRLFFFVYAGSLCRGESFRWQRGRSLRRMMVVLGAELCRATGEVTRQRFWEAPEWETSMFALSAQGVMLR